MAENERPFQFFFPLPNFFFPGSSRPTGNFFFLMRSRTRRKKSAERFWELDPEPSQKKKAIHLHHPCTCAPIAHQHPVHPSPITHAHPVHPSPVHTPCTHRPCTPRAPIAHVHPIIHHPPPHPLPHVIHPPQKTRPSSRSSPITSTKNPSTLHPNPHSPPPITYSALYPSPPLTSKFTISNF